MRDTIDSIVVGVVVVAVIAMCLVAALEVDSRERKEAMAKIDACKRNPICVQTINRR